MKKLLLSLLCLLTVGISAFAAEKSYTVTFTTATKDGTVALTTSSAASAYIASGGANISGIKATDKVYNNGIKGLKFSSSSVSGYIEWNLAAAAQVNATKVVVKSCKWKSSDSGVKVAVNSAAAQDVTSDTMADYTFTLDGSKLTTLKIQATKRIYVESVTVYYNEDSNTVAAPTFSKAAGSFSEPFGLTLSCATEGATIYYTTDGTEPDAVLGDMYAGDPINITETTTVKAFATKSGMTNSAVAEATYTYFNDKCANIAEWLTKATDKANIYTITGEVTVVANLTSNDTKGSNFTYVQDASGSLLVFGVKNTCTAGQTLTGLKGNYADFKNLVEMTNSNVAILTPGTGTAPQPAEMTVGAITATDMNKYVKLTKATFDPTAKTLTQGTDNLAVFYRFTGVDVPTEAGEYDVEGFVCVYETTLQIYPTKFTKVAQEANISWSAESVNFTWEPNYASKLPTLNNPDNVAVTYASSNAAIAEVDAATGAVTLKAPGTANISATAGTKTVSYSLTVGIANLRTQNLIQWEGTTVENGEMTFTATMGANNTFPTIKVAEGYNLVGTVYDAFAQAPADGGTGNVATINGEGVITLVAPGTCRIGYIWGAANPFIAPDNFSYVLTVEPAAAPALQAPVFYVFKSTGFDAVTDGEVLKASDTPVALEVDNNNANSTMMVFVMKAPSEEDAQEGNFTEFDSVEGFTGTEWVCKKTIKDAGYYHIEAMISDNAGNEASATFNFTIEGPKTYIAPIVSFTAGEDEDEVEDGGTAEAPVNMYIENYAYNNSKIYYFITTSETDPEYTVSDENVATVINEPGAYRYKAYVASYEGSLLTGISPTVEGTITVLAAKPKDPTFAATDKDGAAVANQATVAEDKAPVTVVITNPYPGETLYVSVANIDNGSSNDYQTTEATYTVTLGESGQWGVGAMQYVNGNETYAEFDCTIEGEIRYNLSAPYVLFLDADDEEVESPATKLPLRMVIASQNYYEGVKMIYTINGEEKTSDEQYVEIELTEPGTITYSVVCKLGTKSVSATTEGTYEITAEAVKLAAPTIVFTTPEGETEPVTVTITNPNLNGVGTILYSIGTSAWFEGEGATVTFTLPADGVYTIRAYVRNNSDETLSSEITTAEYTLDGIESIGFGVEGVKVVGGHIVAPEGAEVYSISGMRVNTLDRVAAGIYIVRLANGTTTKVIVK